MAVILPNAHLTARKKKHAFARDAHGSPVSTTEITEVGPYPGAVTDPDDTAVGNQYRLRVDPRCHELRPADELVDETGRVFIVRTARLVTVPGDDAVDFIRVNADLDPPKAP